MNINLGFVADASGTDTITATWSPAPASLYNNLLLFFVAAAANTSTTPTLNANGLGAKTIVKKGGSALSAGDIPGANAVMAVCYDATNTRWELLNPATGKGYVLQGGQAAINPADATTYYFNRIFGSTTNTTDGRLSLYVPKAGTVKAAVVTVLHGGTAGSSETSTVSLRLNSITDTTITSNFRTDLDATYGSVGLSIAVAQGDLLEFKWVTPTWATNPLGVSFNTIIYIE